MRSEGLVRIAVAVIVLGVVALGGVAMHDVVSLVGNPWPGFGVLPNGEVAPPLLRSAALAGQAEVPGFQDRIVAVDGEPAVGPGVLRERLGTIGAGREVRYTVERPDGTTAERVLPVLPFTRADLNTLWLPLFLGGIFGLILGAVPVLARPDLVAARLFFLLNVGLTVNFGFLTLDYFAVHRFSPWSLAAGVLATGCLIHLALHMPEPFPLVRRFPRATAALVYGLNGAFWVAFALAAGPLHAPALVRALDVGELGLFALGSGLLLWNLLRSARGAATAGARQLARVIVGGLLVVVPLGGIVMFATTFGWIAVRIPLVVHLAPLWAIGGLLAYAMVAHNLFEMDVMVRRALTAALLVAGVVLFQAVLYMLVRPVVEGPAAWAFAATLSALAIAVTSVVVPLPANLEALVERRLFPGRETARAAVRDAGRALVRLRVDDDIVAVLRTAVARGLGAASLRVIVAGPGAAAREIGLSDDAPPLPLDGRALRGAMTEPGVTVLDAPEQGIQVVVPLPEGHSVRGALLLGPRTDGRLYTREDELLAETLAAQAVVALEHAHAWEAIAGLERRLRAENLYLRQAVTEDTGRHGEMVGSGPALRATLAQLERVAVTDAAVLVQGETGTGKELLVRALHEQSRRRRRMLVKVACAALPETLLESELFGYERGAFTGATDAKPGRFEVADGGTLFLDDVDTLPLGVQAKLLRALQEGEVQRLGSTRPRHVDVRLVAATNRDLLAEVRAGRFREDLFYRLNVVPLRLPPLRERREDIRLLVEHFVSVDGPRLNSAVRAVSTEALAALERYPWPGNVRELRNVIQRALVLSSDDVLRLPGPLVADDATGEAEAEGDARPLAVQVHDLKVRRIRAALERSGGNQRIAAQHLGLHRQSLTRMLRDLNLQQPQGDAPAPAARRRGRTAAGTGGALASA
jgi:transcriptional regulator with GAF, ATPase, and Fis domain